MYRRIPVIIVVSLLLLSGCSGRQSGQGEELTELTDVMSEEEMKDETVEGTEEKSGETKEIPGDESQDAGSPLEMYVHVCGQVAVPGVYKLPLGSRLFEAVDAAGGLLPDAAEDFLNQAARVEDGQQIYVPSREEAAQGMAGRNMPGAQDTMPQGMSDNQAAAGSGQASDDGKIDLNTASREQLMTLSGIGEAKAGSIIAYREAHGGFQRIEELMEVEGIKEGVFNKVKDQIKVL